MPLAHYFYLFSQLVSSVITKATAMDSNKRRNYLPNAAQSPGLCFESITVALIITALSLRSPRIGLAPNNTNHINSNGDHRQRSPR